MKSDHRRKCLNLELARVEIAGIVADRFYVTIRAVTIRANEI